MEDKAEHTQPAKPWARKVSASLLPGLILVIAIVAIWHGDKQAGATMLLILPGAVIYFIPAYLAHSRHNPNAAAITVLNIFLGWTFLGWVAALVWSFTKSGDIRAE